jgi:hypothetical protein
MQNEVLPILITGYSRPDLLRRQLQTFKDDHRVRLYVAVDGSKGVADKQQVAECVALARQLVPNQQRVLIRKNNRGCRYSMEEAITWFFDAEPCGLILEDDVHLNPSFVPVINKLLNVYTNNSSIYHVNCFSAFNDQNTKLAFRYSSFISSWGWATWRDRWSLYNPSLVMTSEGRANLKKAVGGVRNAIYFALLFRLTRQEKYDSWAYRWNCTIYQRGGIALTPSRRLVALSGTGVAATHTTGLRHLGSVQLTPKSLEDDEVAVLESDPLIDHTMYTQVGRTTACVTWVKLCLGICMPQTIWKLMRTFGKRLLT